MSPSAREVDGHCHHCRARFALDYSDLGHPKQRRLHDEFKPACPRFATVCLELGRVNDCFFRDRDRM
jgi:hypothetical protein